MIDKLRALLRDVADKRDHYAVLIVARAKHSNATDLQYLAGNHDALEAVYKRIKELLDASEGE